MKPTPAKPTSGLRLRRKTFLTWMPHKNCGHFLSRRGEYHHEHRERRDLLARDVLDAGPCVRGLSLTVQADRD
jgi:hypothetical protein